MICVYTNFFINSSIILILSRKYYNSCVKLYRCPVYMFITCTMPKSRQSLLSLKLEVMTANFLLNKVDIQYVTCQQGATPMSNIGQEQNSMGVKKQPFSGCVSISFIHTLCSMSGYIPVNMQAHTSIYCFFNHPV